MILGGGELKLGGEIPPFPRVLYETLSVTTFICSYRMLQVNIGRLVYPDYEINVTQPIFSSGEDFERY